MTTHIATVKRSRSRGWTITRRILVGLAATLAVVALVSVTAASYTVARSFPRVSGEIVAAGLSETVTVQRDGSGVPSISASNMHDLFFAQGYVHAQDRFWEMDFRRHLTSARLSELFGASQLGTDKFLRTLGWRQVAEQEVDALDDEVRAYYDAYADGVNAYLEGKAGADVSLEYAVLALQNPGYTIEEWTPADSVAWLKAMAWDLRSNMEEETERALLAQTVDAETLATLYPAYPFDRNPTIVQEQTNAPAPTTATAAAGESARGDEIETALRTLDWEGVSDIMAEANALLGDTGEGIGSNSWVVSGDLTDTGLPLLANDPHLGAALPSVWTQMQLSCAPVTADCPYRAAGFSFSGLPGIVIGHNDSIAWGFTNLTTDVADLYIEKIDGDSYLRDGKRVPIETRTETIKIAGGTPVELEIRSTVHGPLVSDLTDDLRAVGADPRVGTGGSENEKPAEGEYAVALRWTALDPGTTASAIFDLNLARNFEDFRAAAAKFDVPAQNLVYADLEGNIGYQAPGRLPIRGKGDGWLPQPGWDSAYDWQGYIPFEDLPRVYNPTAGYIVTANNAIVPDSYEHFLSRDWDYGYRAARIQSLIERRAAQGKLTADDMRQIQMDNEMWMGKQLAATYADVMVVRPEVRDAIELLRSWDAQNGLDSGAAAYANVLWKNLLQLMFEDKGLPTGDHARLFTVVMAAISDDASPLWVNEEQRVDNRQDMLALAASRAYDELVSLQGERSSRWSWGKLHAITLTHQTFGKSGIAPIEAVFNRGPYPVGGGASVVNATGWSVSGGYATSTVPSMRMVIDLADFDASTWINLTGASGHAFHPNYVDQADDWRLGVQRPWPYSPEAVTAAATDTLVLTPRR